VRTLLTYVLAALAAIVFAGLIDFADAFTRYLAQAGQGDPAIVAPTISRLLMTVPIALVANIVLVGPAWMATRFLFQRQGIEIRDWGLVATGAVIYLILITAVEQVVTLVVSQSLATNGLVLRTAEHFVAGAAWGTVFWLRAPKPQTAGIAA
jgi:hypothetical protein